MAISAASYQSLTIAGIKEEVFGFKTFSFAYGHHIHYKAGQYLTFVKEIQGEEIRRSYSITSSPVLDEPLSIGVKRMDNGLFSRWLIDTAKEGDELLTTGAGGFFTLPQDIFNYRQVFFFAAGSGITPVFSLVKTLLHEHPLIKIVLIYSNASEEKVIFYKELLHLSHVFSNQLQIEFLFSNHRDLNKARLNRDLLLMLVERFSVFPFHQTLFYTCGPESYMRLCIFVLQANGVPKENIRRENFITHKIAVLPSPPDQSNRKAFIKYGKSEFEIDVRYPDSVLKAAKKKGVILPYSCEAGQCGNCVALCTKGNIWHSNNEVLTDKELENGLVLTCVGHPVDGDVYLEIN